MDSFTLSGGRTDLFLRDDFLLYTYPVQIAERLLIAVIFLFVILEQNYSDQSFFKMKSFKLFSRLGVITYGLYCLHFIGILIATTVTSRLSWNTHLWQVFFLDTSLALFITIFISSLSYRFFELPFLKMNARISYISKGAN
jgi:peptidoglycan/LPS O-acetylase OafA/YrhL